VSVHSCACWKNFYLIATGFDAVACQPCPHRADLPVKSVSEGVLVVFHMYDVE
jgi:hypothetical protein